jgi:HEAT repeat protein
MNTPDERTNEMALEALLCCHIPEAADLLWNFTQPHDEMPERVQALKILGKLGDQRVPALLVEHLLDGYDREIIDLLVSMKAVQVMPRLRELAEQYSDDEEAFGQQVRLAALEALVRLGDATYLDQLLAALASEQNDMRYNTFSDSTIYSRTSRHGSLTRYCHC